ncbi:Dityrosine transporter 1 [Entomophthora muscae]|uniref:Dityrosine transporter 1 n=1 Tax=Entomophthora muscae TaxID=34485 RepID=A0ACC2S0R2_9FUNG|nr:Dityrosine transporter 1 [Entomophthora muscae]
MDLEMKFTVGERRQILSSVMFAGLLSPLCSSCYFPALGMVASGLNTTNHLVDLSVSVYLVTMGVCPILWGTLADIYGRRKLMIVASIIFVCASAACGFASDIWLLISLRILQALGASASIVIGIGVIADIYPREERGSAMGLFMIGPLLGPVLGPPLGGLITHYLTWHAVFWVITALGIVSLISILFLLPETLSQRKPSPLRCTNTFPFFEKSGKFPNPFASLSFLLYVKIILPTFYTCIILMLYFYIGISQSHNLKPYSLSQLQLGLSYLPLGLADIIGSYLGGRISDISFKFVKTRHEECPSEARLALLPLGIILISCGVVLLAFLLDEQCSIIVVLSVLMVVCVIMGVSFGLIGCYIMDAFPKHAASTSAACNLLRSTSCGVSVSFSSLLSSRFSAKQIFLSFSILQLFGFVVLAILIPLRRSLKQGDSIANN